MSLPESIRDSLETEFGTRVQDCEPVSGGMINQTAAITLNSGNVFVKWNESAPAGLYAAEADGLNALRSTRTIRIPEVFFYRDSGEVEVPFLVLEWIPPAAAENNEAFSRNFAEQLAALHAVDVGTQFGWATNNYLGNFSQRNTHMENWPEFYRVNRLEPQIELARQKRLLTPDHEVMLQKICWGLPAIFYGMGNRPSLIHGDLWSGNFINDGQCPVLIDPAVYLGHREAELAFIELFDGFPPDFIKYYQQISPTWGGYERRRPVHQLYYLLVHLNTFGETYGPALERACALALRPPDSETDSWFNR